MSTMTRMRSLPMLVAAIAIALLAAPFNAGAQTTGASVAVATASTTFTAVGQDPDFNNCKPEAQSLINSKLPAEFTIGGEWTRQSSDDADSYYYTSSGPATGIFDEPTAFSDDELDMGFLWDPTTGAVTEAGMGTSTMDATINGNRVEWILEAGFDDGGTGTLTRNADGAFAGTITLPDFRLSMRFPDLGNPDLSNDEVFCTMPVTTVDLVFTATADAPALNLTLEFNVGDSIRTGNLPVTTQGDGLEANAPYTVVLRSDPVQIGQGTTTAEGSFTNTSPLPADTPAGPHSVTVTSTTPAGAPIDGVGYFTIDDNGIVTAISYDGPTPAADASTLAAASSAPSVAAVPAFTG